MGNTFDYVNSDSNGPPDFTGGFQMMGMLGALKTGDIHIDMLIALTVPLILKFLFDRLGKLEDLLQDWWETWMEYSRQPSEPYERFISYSTTRSSRGNMYNTDEDTQNSVLMKSIKLYLVSLRFPCTPSFSMFKISNVGVVALSSAGPSGKTEVESSKRRAYRNQGQEKLLV
jgi:hypothetical protein